MFRRKHKPAKRNIINSSNPVFLGARCDQRREFVEDNFSLESLSNFSLSLGSLSTENSFSFFHLPKRRDSRGISKIRIGTAASEPRLGGANRREREVGGGTKSKKQAKRNGHSLNRISYSCSIMANFQQASCDLQGESLRKTRSENRRVARMLCAIAESTRPDF